MKGADAEDLALRHLQAQGLTLLQRNFRARGGELDLVMRERGKPDTLVIVEVRKRGNARYGNAIETIGTAKRQRIVLAARWLLASNAKFADMPVRFDVIALDANDRVEWIRGAFDAD